MFLFTIKVDAKFLKNLRFSKKHNKKGLKKQKKLAGQQEQPMEQEAP